MAEADTMVVAGVAGADSCLVDWLVSSARSFCKGDEVAGSGIAIAVVRFLVAGRAAAFSEAVARVVRVVAALRSAAVPPPAAAPQARGDGLEAGGDSLVPKARSYLRLGAAVSGQPSASQPAARAIDGA